MSITVTEAANEKIVSIMRRRQTPDSYLRIGLRGGGCSGFKYHYEFVEMPTEHDKVFEFGDVKICVDKKSYIFLHGLEIDYEEDLMRSGLVFRAPSAQRSCGCGESISF